MQIALIGVKEDRKSINNVGCSDAPDRVRNHLYDYYNRQIPISIVDLGNINAGFSIEDTYYAVSAVVKELVKNNIVPVIRRWARLNLREL